TQPMLIGLAVVPVDTWVHVGIKAEVVGIRFVPCGQRLVVRETDLHDGFRALESILPRYNETNGRAVLVGQGCAVHSEAKQCQRVHGLIHAQTFYVRPIENSLPLSWHLAGIVNRRELYELCFTEGFSAFNHLA